VTHVFDDAEDLDIDLREHLEGLARVFEADVAGVETTTAPVSGTVWTSEMTTSPVPGGRSTMR